MKRSLFLLLFAFCFAGSARAEVAWPDVSAPVGDILHNRERSGFGPSDTDTLSNRRLDGMLDEAAAILADNPGAGARQELASLRESIAASRDRIAKLRFEAAGAPEGDGSMTGSLLSRIGLSTPTRGGYEERIAEEQRSIDEREARYATLEQGFGKDLERIGIHLTPEQMKGLMSMATADDIVAMQAAFENMKSINRELQAATARSGESLDVARRYYGIYAVMLEIALRMDDQFIARVDNDYLARLSKISGEADAARHEAERLMASTDDRSLRDVLTHNVSAQKLTIEAAGAYRNRLVEQRDRIDASRRLIGLRHEVAVNTWKTVRLSSDLVDMMRSTDKDFDALLNLDIPELKPFESIQMQQEFEKLTRRISAPPS